MLLSIRKASFFLSTKLVAVEDKFKYMTNGSLKSFQTFHHFNFIILVELVEKLCHNWVCLFRNNNFFFFSIICISDEDILLASAESNNCFGRNEIIDKWRLWKPMVRRIPSSFYISQMSISILHRFNKI